MSNGKIDEKSFQLGAITPANVQQLRVLINNTFPVRYSDKFYRELTSTYDGEYLRFAFWNGFVIGGICSRVESTEESTEKKLYIMILNVLAPYRRRGIATKLLDYVLEKAKADSAITEVFLHVQTSNEDAKNFYLHHGFEEKDIIKGYYKNIDPPDCFLLSKKIEHPAV